MTTEEKLNEIRYLIALGANQLAKDGHDELAHDLDDARMRLLAMQATFDSEREDARLP